MADNLFQNLRLSSTSRPINLLMGNSSNISFRVRATPCTHKTRDHLSLLSRYSSSDTLPQKIPKQSTGERHSSFSSSLIDLPIGTLLSPIFAQQLQLQPRR